MNNSGSVLEKYNFPNEHSGKVNNFFHIITSLLLDNEDTKERIIDFIFERGGRLGMVNVIKAYSLIGNDTIGRCLIDQLFLLVEALVYPNKSYKHQIPNEDKKFSNIVKSVYESNKKDWFIDYGTDDRVLLSNNDIKIRKSEQDERPILYEWAVNHCNSEAYRIEYSITYRELVIDSFALACVDGSRAQLPFPKPGSNIIPRKKYQLGLLFNDEDNLQRYIRLSGLSVE